MAAATELISRFFWDGFLSAGKLAVDDHPNVSMPGRSLSDFQGRL